MEQLLHQDDTATATTDTPTSAVDTDVAGTVSEPSSPAAVPKQRTKEGGSTSRNRKGSRNNANEATSSATGVGAAFSVEPGVVPHVNYAWRTLDRVKYPRCPAGDPVLVWPPAGVEGEARLVDPTALLRTRALDGPRDTYRLCAHYTVNDACDYGAECTSIHTVFIASDARLYQKATHYRRHEGRRAVEELSTVAHAGDGEFERDDCDVQRAAVPRRYFYRDPYTAAGDHRVFVCHPWRPLLSTYPSPAHS